MRTEDKELLLKDLCGRLPYGVICKCYHTEYNEWDGKPFVAEYNDKLITIDSNGSCLAGGFDYDIEEIKPYLRPISSMTEDEKIELKQISNNYLDEWENAKTPIERLKLDAKVSYKRAVFYNSHHFDWNDLIPKGLAIEVTEENNPYNKE